MRGDSSFGYLWLFVSALYPAAMVTAIVHEFGHAAATWLVGARVYSITIGTGAPIWKLRSPTFELALGSNPFLGGEISHFYDQGAPVPMVMLYTRAPTSHVAAAWPNSWTIAVTMAAG